MVFLKPSTAYPLRSYTQDMKKHIALLLTIYSSISLGDTELMEMFVQGKYILVGKGLDTDKTYFGEVKIKSVNNKLIVEREINKKSVKGSAAIEYAVGGDAQVLRIRFTEDGDSYEQTCLVNSDLDNYARISCYLYKPGIKTMQPGLEVLFHDHTAK